MRLNSPANGISPLAGVMIGGLVAALLDILYAFAAAGLRGVSPARVLQTVASGLLGRASYQGGAGSASLGLLLHTAIALVMAAVYVAATRALPGLNRRPGLSGLAYGLICYLAMNHIVLVLRFGPRPTPDLTSLIGGLLIHMLGVGLPIALAARRVNFDFRSVVPASGAATPSA